MSQRINPIGPYERRSMPVQRVERRKPTEDHHQQPEDGYEQFEEQLERGLHEQEPHGEPPSADTPAVKVDLSTGVDPKPSEARRSGAAGAPNRRPVMPEDGHVDVSA